MKLLSMLKYIILIVIGINFSFSSYSYEFNSAFVEIIRDEYGVPHIYGKTDADVAYGLGWATAEDDFESMQENFLLVRRRLGEYKGKEGAMMDYFSFLMEASEIVEKKYEKDISDDFKEVLNAYSQAVNKYAEKHKDEILIKGLFPISEKDIIAGYVVGMGAMTNIPFTVFNIYNGSTKERLKHIPYARGSNGFAIGNKRTVGNSTFLAINSHQPLDGPQSWYECHLISEEGMNILGGAFPGSPTILHGVNNDLAWAHTVNWPDLVDVFLLEMNPDKKLEYKYDNKWLKLEVKKIKLKVKFWIFKIPIRKKIYKSIFGNVIKRKGNYYALKFPATQEIRSGEQWYMMNKATDFESFYKALSMHAFPGLNTIYTDKDYNIFMYSAGQFPKRRNGIDWLKVVPGNTSENNWDYNWASMDKLPQYLNPDCGFF